MSLDIQAIRQEFPILNEQVNGKPLVYLDSAATSQKPQAVIDALVNYYTTSNSNVHRGVHTLSDRATNLYEGARDKVQKFIHAADRSECVFVRGATEALNLVSNTFARQFLKSGDTVLVTEMEHHSNIVPWQILRDEMGIQLKFVPVLSDGSLDLEAYDQALTDDVKFVSLNHVSNALGSINPVKELVKKAHAKGLPVLLDGCQAAPHMKIDVQDLDCDFYVFSGHKMYAPTGIGVLYARREWLDLLPPYQGGGDMIKTVDFDKSTFNEAPYKFEAGTPNIAGVVGLGAAIDWMNQFDLAEIGAHEHRLEQLTSQALSEIEGVRLVGTAQNKTGVVSFVMEGDIHPNDIGSMLDQQGIAIRAGHHCAMPVLKKLCVGSTARASFGIYNTEAEVEQLIDGIKKIQRLFL